MRAEVEAIPESDWRPHPQGNPGNSALPLIALGGNPLDDGVAGTMLPTPHLEKCEYLRQVLASFETVFGRSRLMRLEGKSEATLHVDSNYYWADRVRIHVPILTSPVIEFICNGRSLHMAAGEAWIFDAWQPHNVLNPTGDQRIHLVGDTVGSAAFWELVERGERPFSANGSEPQAAREIAHRPGEAVSLETERANYPVVMSPWEQQHLCRTVLADLAGNGENRRSDWPSTTRDRRVQARLARRLGALRPAPRGLAGVRPPAQAARRADRPARGQPGADQQRRRGRDRPPDADPPGAQPPARRERSGSGGGGARRPAGPSATASGPGSQQPQQPQPHGRESPLRAGSPDQQTGRASSARSSSSPRRARGRACCSRPWRARRRVWTIGGESHQVIEGVPGLHPPTAAGTRTGSPQPTPPRRPPSACAPRFLAQLRDRDENRPPRTRTACGCSRRRRRTRCGCRSWARSSRRRCSSTCTATRASR